MLALSPPLFSTTYGWPSELENLTPPNFRYRQHECNDISIEFEANSYNLFQDSHTYNQIHQDLAPECSISISSEGYANENIGEPPKVAKNLNHNANERDRRRRVNELYASLRSLLPMSTDLKKKVSIPQIVSRALKYIPQLQKEVETLISKKEEISSYSSSSSANKTQDHLRIKKKSSKDALIHRKSSLVSSVSVLGEKEVVIQLMFSTKHMIKNKDVGFLSKVLDYLEHEENGFVLLNSTAFILSGQGMSSDTLRFQAQGDNKIDVERLQEKLCSFFQQSD